MARLLIYVFTKLNNLQQGLRITCGAIKDVRKEFDAVIIVIAAIIVIVIIIATYIAVVVIIIFILIVMITVVSIIITINDLFRTVLSQLLITKYNTINRSPCLLPWVARVEV